MGPFNVACARAMRGQRKHCTAERLPKQPHHVSSPTCQAACWSGASEAGRVATARSRRLYEPEPVSAVVCDALFVILIFEWEKKVRISAELLTDDEPDQT